jgi:hypothetical protein
MEVPVMIELGNLAFWPPKNGFINRQCRTQNFMIPASLEHPPILQARAAAVMGI